MVSQRGWGCPRLRGSQPPKAPSAEVSLPLTARCSQVKRPGASQKSRVEGRDYIQFMLCSSSYFCGYWQLSAVISFLFCLFFFCFLWPHLRHMEVLGLQVESKLQLPAYATATPDPSHVCNLCHSSQQHQILNSLSKAWDQICILMDAGSLPLSHNGNSSILDPTSLMELHNQTLYCGALPSALLGERGCFSPA